jgi:hypothetical protein
MIYIEIPFLESNPVFSDSKPSLSKIFKENLDNYSAQIFENRFVLIMIRTVAADCLLHPSSI